MSQSRFFPAEISSNYLNHPIDQAEGPGSSRVSPLPQRCFRSGASCHLQIRHPTSEMFGVSQKYHIVEIFGGKNTSLMVWPMLCNMMQYESI